MDYLPHSPQELEAMLDTIGVSGLEELFEQIPGRLRLQRTLDIAGFESEYDVRRHLESLAATNSHTESVLSFLGGGVYDHTVPTVIDTLVSRGEYLTAYTPYQPETSQGSLQALFEFQSMICDLTGMDVANSSVYDGANAFVEAAMMTLRCARKKNHLLLAGTIHPDYRDTVRTYFQNLDVTLDFIPADNGVIDPDRAATMISGDTAALMIQTPNFFGCLEDTAQMGRLAKDAGVMLVASINPISLGLLNPPGGYGADITVGEGQPLGNELQFGGPYFGFFATVDKYKRQMPGRIVGQTVDSENRRGFVLTLQAREQHIRRAKATSNICTNSALCALRAAIYMALLGPDGLREVARVCYEKAHCLAHKISALEGFELTFDQPFFNEFTLTTPVPAADICRQLQHQNILAGLDLGRFDHERKNQLLIAVTEKIMDADRFVTALQDF
ncbi:aminomethyl-transferring glycine dehydrogenase subunit GcvPA [Planctomycetota bacterium]